MTAQQLRILAAAVSYVVWKEKVPSPDGLNDREEELFNAVRDTFTDEQWWEQTYAPEGWPEDAA